MFTAALFMMNSRWKKNQFSSIWVKKLQSIHAAEHSVAVTKKEQLTHITINEPQNIYPKHPDSKEYVFSILSLLYTIRKWKVVHIK